MTYGISVADRWKGPIGPHMPADVPSLPASGCKLPKFPDLKTQSSSKLSPLIEKAASMWNKSVRFLDRHLYPIRTVVNLRGFVDVILAPLHVLSIVQHCLSFNRHRREKKIDVALDITTNFKEIGEGGLTFVGALEEAKVTRALSGPWMMPFGIVMSVFSIASIVSNIRTIRKVRHLLKEINQAEAEGMVDGKPTKQCYRNILKLFDRREREDTDFLREYFNVDEWKMCGVLVQAEMASDEKYDSENVEDHEKGLADDRKVIEALKGRLQKTIRSTALSILASAVTIIGTAILIASPLSPIGWAVLGIAAMTDIGLWINHKITEYRFAKAVHLKRTAMEWVLC